MTHPRLSRGLGGAVFAILVGLAFSPAMALAARGASASASAAASSVTTPPVRPSPVDAGVIRLATFNIAWLTGRPKVGFVPRSKKDMRRIARIIRGTHAHLVCMQEILDAAALEVLAREINKLSRGETDFDFRADDGKAILSPPGERAMNQGIGLLYDRKVLRVRKARFLEELAGDGQMIRAPLWARVDVRGNALDFDFVGLHLKSGMFRKWAQEIRTKEVGLLTDWMTKGRVGDDPDLVIMGDFNAARDDDTLAGFDEMADSGELVAVEDHLLNGQVGTHIPWEVGIDRGFMTRSLWRKSGIRGGASIYRFDDFMPGAHKKEDFCIRSRTKLKKASLRCSCSDRPEPAEPEEGQEDWAGACAVDTMRWAKAKNYLRVSDHRPLLWDLRLPRKRSRKK